MASSCCSEGWKQARLGGMDFAKLDWVLPHQANGSMDRHLRMHLPSGAKVVVHADRVGNTGSAAIWLAFDEIRKSLSPGQSVLVLGAEATQYMYGDHLPP